MHLASHAFFDLYLLRIVAYLMDPHANTVISEIFLSLGLKTKAIGLYYMADFTIKAVVWVVAIFRVVVRSTSIAS